MKTLDGQERAVAVPLGVAVCELEVSEAHGPKTVPPAGLQQTTAKYAFNEHLLLAAAVLDENGEAQAGHGIVFCQRCGAYCSASSGADRSRPTALLAQCAGRRAGEGLKLQKRRLEKRLHPAHADVKPKAAGEMVIAELVNLSPWQTVALEDWDSRAELAAPKKPKDDNKVAWTEGLNRQAVLTAFGLDAVSLEALVARFGQEERAPEAGDEDMSDRWFDEKPAVGMSSVNLFS